MTTETKRPGTPTFVALEVALELIRSLRGIVKTVRRHNSKLAGQIEDAASSVAANVAEGNRRQGKDRHHLFRIAAGSADETRAHLRVAEAWGWVSVEQIETPLALIDRELGLLWGLTR
jgi:four helix bundle protein